jgi:hypothetical protein
MCHKLEQYHVWENEIINEEKGSWCVMTLYVNK